MHPPPPPAPPGSFSTTTASLEDDDIDDDGRRERATTTENEKQRGGQKDIEYGLVVAAGPDFRNVSSVANVDPPPSAPSRMRAGSDGTRAGGGRGGGRGRRGAESRRRPNRSGTMREEAGTAAAMGS